MPGRERRRALAGLEGGRGGRRAFEEFRGAAGRWAGGGGGCSRAAAPRQPQPQAQPQSHCTLAMAVLAAGCLCAPRRRCSPASESGWQEAATGEPKPQLHLAAQVGALPAVCNAQGSAPPSATRALCWRLSSVGLQPSLLTCGGGAARVWGSGRHGRRGTRSPSGAPCQNAIFLLCTPGGPPTHLSSRATRPRRMVRRPAALACASHAETRSRPLCLPPPPLRAPLLGLACICAHRFLLSGTVAGSSWTMACQRARS